MHRDWDVDSNINVFMHKEHIEIVSPETLQNGITKEEYLQGGISILKNPIIGMVFFRLNLIESLVLELEESWNVIKIISRSRHLIFLNMSFVYHYLSYKRGVI